MTSADNLVLNRQAVREVDRAAIEDYAIPGIVLMENAARGLAEHALDMLTDVTSQPPRVLIICGRGNNGGDGYALARHLTNQDIDVTLAILGDPKPKGDAGINQTICRHMNIPEVSPEVTPNKLNDLGEFHLIVDAIFGTGLDRPVTGPIAAIIEWINSTGLPVLAADCPSGLDCDTGRPLGSAVLATRTVTFVALKPGFLHPKAKPYTGAVFVAQIGAPAFLIERFGVPPRTPGPPPD